jgi:hypothetical protein
MPGETVNRIEFSQNRLLATGTPVRSGLAQIADRLPIHPGHILPGQIAKTASGLGIVTRLTVLLGLRQVRVKIPAAQKHVATPLTDPGTVETLRTHPFLLITVIPGNHRHLASRTVRVFLITGFARNPGTRLMVLAVNPFLADAAPDVLRIAVFRPQQTTHCQQQQCEKMLPSYLPESGIFLKPTDHVRLIPSAPEH